MRAPVPARSIASVEVGSGQPDVSERLMAAMTWQEKLGQLRAITLPSAADGQDFQDAALLETLRAARVGTVAAPRSRGEAQHLQRIAIEQTRLGIPLLFADGLDPSRWPNPAALAATWDEAAVARLAGATRRNASGDGVTWLATPAFAPDEGECDTRDAPRVLPEVLSRRIRAATCRGIEGATQIPEPGAWLRQPQRALALLRSDDTCTAPLAADYPGSPASFAGPDFSTWHGLDVEMLAELDTPDAETVRVVDDHVRSLLAAKARLGLFRDPFSRHPDMPPADRVAADDARRDVIARSMILLANGAGVLPLAPDGGGVLAISAGNGRAPWLGEALDAVGIAHRRISGLALRQDAVADTRTLLKADGLAIGIACDAASRTDTVIVALSDDDCVGEPHSLPRPGPAASALLGTLVNASARCVLVSATSLPIDPASLPIRLAGVLHTWEPGEGYAAVLGAVLAGKVAPSGRLPWPIGPAGDPQARPCGFGLTYGEIAYSRFTLDVSEDAVIAAVSLTNTGCSDVCETVQLYLRWPGETGEDAAMHLADFARIDLRSGATVRFAFELGSAQLGRAAGPAHRSVASGSYAIMVGRDRDQLLAGEVTVPAGLARQLSEPPEFRASDDAEATRSA